MAASESLSGEDGRILTQQEAEKLKKDTKLVSDFQRNKLEAEARRNWDLFYKRNQTNFFKDRHWITREFPELLQPEVFIIARSSISQIQCSQNKFLLEAGCGVGNALFPLAEETKLFIYACDFSPRAVDMVKVSYCYAISRARMEFKLLVLLFTLFNAGACVI